MAIVSLDQRVVPHYSALRRGVRRVSAHRHAINFTPQNRPDVLLALVDEHIPQGPRQLRCQALPPAHADLAACFQAALPKAFSCTLRVPQGDLNREVIALGWQVLAQAASPPPSAFHAAVHKRLQQGIATLCQALPGTAALDEAVCGILGLGTGLTPSGDDFLAGLALALHLPQSPYHHRLNDLRRALLRHTHRCTHAISAAFIHDALHGETSAPVQAFIRLLDAQPPIEKGETYRTIHELTALGHSSGHDLLSGLLAGLSFHPNRSTTLCPCIAN